jgi:hypothetical protein
MAAGPSQAGIDDIVGGIRGMMADNKAAGADTQVPQAKILERSSPKRPGRPDSRACTDAGAGCCRGGMRVAHHRASAAVAPAQCRGGTGTMPDCYSNVVCSLTSRCRVLANRQRHANAPPESCKRSKNTDYISCFACEKC